MPNTMKTLKPSIPIQRILATIDSIPRGKVATYGGIARAALLPGRARMVGRALREAGGKTKLPWHRVVNASGQSSLSGKSALEQKRRLRAEGVEISAKGRVDLARYEWKGAD